MGWLSLHRRTKGIGLLTSLTAALAAGAGGVGFVSPNRCVAQETQETGLPPIPPEDQQNLSGQAAVEVKGFRFEGNSVFNEEKLLCAPVEIETLPQDAEGGFAALLKDCEDPRVRTRVKSYIGRTVTTEGLEEIRQAITRLYIATGYINSGAILPDQTVEDGVITYKVVEGKLTDVNLEYRDANDPNKVAKPRLRAEYLKSRVRLGAEPPLNIIKLKNELEILRQNPNLARVNAELRPGTEPGEAYLDMQVAETNPWQLGVQISNRRSPSVGAEQVEILASNRNLTGNGDVLSVRYGLNTGGFRDWEFAGADDFSIDYTIPITPADTTLSISYERTDSVVVEQPFDQLDITSESNSIALTIRHPFYRSANTEFAMFLSQAYRDNRTELLGEPFSFSPGAEDGKSVVAPIRFGQEYTTRSQIDAFALRSTFSFGMKYLGATKNNDNDLPDGQYLAWLGQAQYVRRLQKPDDPNPLHDYQLVLRGSAQLASSPLLSIEQFAVGGVDTVRGYRENQIVRDIGFAASVELHVPVIVTASGNRILEAIPFFDIGYGANIHGKAAQTLPSIGIGLQYTPNRHVTGQLYYGYALDRSINQETDNLQDCGIHFNLLLLLF
jgi:hemolysin activation/secretion protein